MSISPARLKIWIGDEGLDDPLAAILAKSARAELERLTGRYFGPLDASWVEYHDGDGTRLLFLHAQPSTDATVVVSHRDEPEGSWTVVDSTDYEIDTVNPRLVYRLDQVWSLGYRNYKAAFERGWEVDQLPGDAEEAVGLIAGKIYRGRVGEAAKNEDAIQTRIDEIAARWGDPV